MTIHKRLHGHTEKEDKDKPRWPDIAAEITAPSRREARARVAALPHVRRVLQVRALGAGMWRVLYVGKRRRLCPRPRRA